MKKKIVLKYSLLAILLWVAVGCITFRSNHPMATAEEFVEYWWEVLTFQDVGYLNMRPDMNMNGIRHTILLTSDR